MKKKYTAPQVKEVRIELQQMLAASLGASDVSGDIVSDSKDQLDFDMNDLLDDWEF